MPLTVKNFTVLNTSTGKMAITGNLVYNYVSINNMTGNLINLVAVQGMPTSLDRPGFSDVAHRGLNLIKISNNFVTNSDEIYAVRFVRIKLVYINCSYKNSILYSFASSETTAVNNLTFNVLFANCHAQSLGDYWDIELPDNTLYPNLFLVLLLVTDGWTRNVTYSGSVYTITPTMYFGIKSSFSSTDTSSPHTINIKGYNGSNGIVNRIILAFEDLSSANTDWDYNDVILSVSGHFSDENLNNDTSIS